MAQAFVSTYKNHYRWNNQPRTPLYDPDKLTKLKPEGDIWLLDANEDIENELRNIAKIEKKINKLYLKRMITTYQVSYCKHIKPIKRNSLAVSFSELNLEKSVQVMEKAEPEESEQIIGNELLEYCKKLYCPKPKKITPALNSSRNVFGYMRPSRLLTPLTTYQNEYGRVGYNVLKLGYDESNSCF